MMSERPQEPWRVVPVVGARDVRRTVAYYCDVLGFRVDPERGVVDGVGDEGAVYALLERDGIEIHVQIRRRDEPPHRRERIERDVYLRVPDVDALHRELRERGASLGAGPRTTPYGMRELEVEDPNGVRLVFGSPG